MEKGQWEGKDVRFTGGSEIVRTPTVERKIEGLGRGSKSMDFRVEEGFLND